MTIIKKENEQLGIYNSAGFQVNASFSANSTGLSPIELLESSLGLCILISLQRMFERDKIEVKDSEFSVEVKATKASEGPSRIEKCQVSIKLPDHLSNEYKRKLVISAERACTIGNSLKKGIQININN